MQLLEDRSRLHGDTAFRQSLMSEWIGVWEDGPGILMLQGAIAPALTDEVTACFMQIIEGERDGGSRGDHFAKAGANDVTASVAHLRPALRDRFLATFRLLRLEHGFPQGHPGRG